ncbi:MAG: AAA family ATPase [Lachnospiraceae bacterium]|nr:AAA family ATPase [Lachnospiraceae bacterium]
MKMKMTCYGHPYPFKLFPEKGLTGLSFAPITIFYGGNGSGKTTLLNVIAQRLEAVRGTYFNRSPFFDDYARACKPKMNRGAWTDNIQMITSDDVFDYVLDIRAMNEGIDRRREELMDDYRERKNYLSRHHASFQMRSLADYEELKAHNAAKRLTPSKYVKENVMGNLPERSNGESAFMYFTEHIKENGIYLLDEPENSLAAGLQIKLAQFIEDSARFFGCQFIMATHSPFLLSMAGAKVYDLDAVPVRERRWTELENVRLYADFFLDHRDEFE